MFTKRFYDLCPYVPGEQPVDRDYVKLNANENPYPPAPAVGTELENFDIADFRRYPDPDSRALCRSIAKMLGNGIHEDMIFAGNGSDEVLSFVFYTFFDSDAPLFFPEHTYSFYPVYAGYYGIPVARIPLESDFSICIDRFLDKPSSGVIFPNPNAPTGIFLPLEKIRSLLERYPAKKAIVIDEAYIDFGGDSAISLLADFPNLVVIRTFSKSFCFAGARLGYAVANPELIKGLLTTKNSFNHFPVDTLTQKMGVAACENSSYYAGINAEIAETRDWFSTELRTLGWDVLPSKANFVFARKSGFSGEQVYLFIKEKGVLVRYFDHSGIEDFVRITIGTPDQMGFLHRIMEEIT
ncbi:MAG TPA: histidinol-phosphate transaminase [Treponema sp.]|nr:histidinol-phosphate transaminase [Treponema sp.]